MGPEDPDPIGEIASIQKKPRTAKTPVCRQRTGRPRPPRTAGFHLVIDEQQTQPLESSISVPLHP